MPDRRRLLVPEDPIPTPLEYYMAFDPPPEEADAEDEETTEEEKDDPWKEWR